MAHYFGRFVPSVHKGLPAGDWERFRNAENPASALKKRARHQASRFHDATRDLRDPLELRAFNDADMSAMMLMWLTREQPPEDKAPDEVWHLTTHGGLIRTTWSAIIEPVHNEVDLREPTIDHHEVDELPVIEIDSHFPEELWRPPSLDDLAERKVVLMGDKRPTSSGAFVERRVERYSPTGLRKPCTECGVVPNAFTLVCKC